MYRTLYCLLLFLLLALPLDALAQEPLPTTPPEWRSKIDAERTGTHDANRIRTLFYNYGMVGDFQVNPDLSIFHSMEVPKGSGLNYSDGVTPFVLARVREENGRQSHIMLTGYRERQARSPITNRIMRFEPRPGFQEPDPTINAGRSIAISNDPRTWPGAMDASGNPRLNPDPETCWYDKRNDSDDPGWCGSWNGFFGKRPNADQESYFVIDDNFYDAWQFYPDSRDRTRRGLGLRVEVRGFQWANPQAQDVIFWHYDIVNEGTTDYEDIIFGLYMDSGVGGSAVSCDGTAESDDDNAFFDRSFGLDLVYTWDRGGHGVSLRSNCEPTGYLGYAYLETPGNPFNQIDDDDDGITDEMRDSGPGQRIEGQDAIRAYVQANYNMASFEREYGPLEERPAYITGVWWTGDEDLDWVAAFNDTGADGIYANDDNPADSGENDGMPTNGESNFDRTDITESDQIGLTGFKMNRIRGPGETDNIVFFVNESQVNWPERLFQQFTDPDPEDRFDSNIRVEGYNIGFLFASGPFELRVGRRERFSLALAAGQDLDELRGNVEIVQAIYDANYQFATPPPAPTVNAFAGDGRVTLVWDNAAEQAADPVTNRNDFEGYRIYRSTDPNFLDPQIILDARGNGPIGNGRPIAQYDLANGITGFSNLAVSGVQYYLGNDSGLTHTFTDNNITNGQTYYYAVTAYDRGAEEFNFYPSENAITVSRTPRGGTILPRNVVEVRPNAQVPGYIAAAIDTESITQAEGSGTGTVLVRILDSEAVPDAHTFRLDFTGFADSVRAQTYTLTDLTTGKVLFEGGTDFSGEGRGPVSAGLQPLIHTLETVEIDSLSTGFTEAASTDATYEVSYLNLLPINLRRPGFPENITITFADTPLDTSRAAIGQPARPAHFKITTESGQQLDFTYRDVNGDRTVGSTGELIDIYTPEAAGSSAQQATWRVEVIEVAQNPPGAGDVFHLALNLPFGSSDVFTFITRGAYVDASLAQEMFDDEKPYVVPNPYVASTSFEPERFATSGRGVRRLEFRAIPAGATIRIYTVRGELVRTLEHDGSITGMVAWDLRTKDNLDVAPGLYVYHVNAPDIGEYVGKFAIIK